VGQHVLVVDDDATVSDVDRMHIRASSRPILVHPSAYYVGIRHKPHTTSTIELIVTDIDGCCGRLRSRARHGSTLPTVASSSTRS